MRTPSSPGKLDAHRAGPDPWAEGRPYVRSPVRSEVRRRIGRRGRHESQKTTGIAGESIRCRPWFHYRSWGDPGVRIARESRRRWWQTNSAGRAGYTSTDRANRYALSGLPEDASLRRIETVEMKGAVRHRRPVGRSQTASPPTKSQP